MNPRTWGTTASAAKFRDFFVHSRISLSNIGGSHASEENAIRGLGARIRARCRAPTSASRRAAPGGVPVSALLQRWR
ncbi:hypothetical protein DBV15_08040 [Temnothorax longispinosus]|uniref:Uncharacterized protein n=1 Tax=Temnothorax longispinosus TaxID=300112 RepID=A0A4S2KMA4_9HYME|nr:hypothetical protein DBV15_08040 [Temnothorax longispinosus]